MGGAWDDIVKGCVVKGVATLQCLPAIFSNVVTAALVFSGVIAVFFIIFAGIKYITSAGDPKQVEGAKQTLTFAIVGLLVVLFSFLIINFIGYVTGADCINQFGFDSCK